jgi:RNA polymerase sigma-B factor
MNRRPEDIIVTAGLDPAIQQDIEENLNEPIRRPTADDKVDHQLLYAYHHDGSMKAREQLIELYLPLVRSLARRYSYRGEQLEDLVQVGCIGLIKAIDRFDIERGVELTTYATPNIIGEIRSLRWRRRRRHGSARVARLDRRAVRDHRGPSRARARLRRARRP